MRVYLVDNYDSFTYNLVELLRQAGIDQIKVERNDKVDFQEVALFDKILISPGPGLPHQAGRVLELLHRFTSSKSILGICLGHQAIACSQGGSLRQLHRILHGEASDIRVDNQEPLFHGLPGVIQGGRYHSWIVDQEALPATLSITASDSYGHIMALSHKDYDVKGVQFHPESYMTPSGIQIIKNWLHDIESPLQIISAL